MAPYTLCSALLLTKGGALHGEWGAISDVTEVLLFYTFYLAVSMYLCYSVSHCTLNMLTMLNVLEVWFCLLGPTSNLERVLLWQDYIALCYGDGWGVTSETADILGCGLNGGRDEWCLGWDSLNHRNHSCVVCVKSAVIAWVFCIRRGVCTVASTLSLTPTITMPGPIHP